MKGFLSLLLALTLPLSVLLTGCRQDGTPPATQEDASQTSQEDATQTSQEDATQTSQEEPPQTSLDDALQTAQEDAAQSDQGPLQSILGQVAAIRAAYDASWNATEEESQAVQALMEVHSVEEREIPTYSLTSDNKSMLDISFFNGNASVAYSEIDDLFGFAKELCASDPGYSLEGAYGDECYLAMRETGNYALIDFTNGSVLFSDYDSFGQSAAAVSGGDVLGTSVWQTTEDGSIVVDEEGQQLVNLFSRLDNSRNFARHSYPIALQPALSNIPLYWVEGQGYLPVTTFMDLFLSDAGYAAVFDGESLFVTAKTGFDDTTTNADGKTMQDLVYEGAKERTKELAEYTYWEMVMMLDCNYGLREEHQIGDDFDAYLTSIGLKDRLLSQDGAEFSEALSELMMGYFGDMHSGVNQASPYAGPDYTINIWTSENLAASILPLLKGHLRYATARATSTSVDDIGNLIPYMEVGDTAYIAFDSFYMEDEQNYYDPAVQETLADSIGTDNIALIHYANEQIKREGSPIKNIVLDISLNGGGMADAAIYIISWVLGECPFSTVNPLTNTQYTVGYKADVNLDGAITEDDRLDLSEVKVYCLTSGSSFSCGNLVPAVFKASGEVTLLGQKSGGGACVVEPAMAADGTVFQYSGHRRLSTVRNGSYYSVDEGIEPDFTISDPAHLYDRAWLTAYLAQLP